MNLIDSSGWLEYFAGGANAGFFAQGLKNLNAVLVPTICVAEVFKKLFAQRGEEAALRHSVQMSQGVIVELTFPIALAAAKIGHELRLPMADSIIYATAKSYGASLWTQDADFEGLPGVKFAKKR
jgi:toxin FitB